MDPPETFAEAAAEVALGAAAETVAPDVEKIAAKHWFALAVAFLLVNAYGVWRWTSHLPSRTEPRRAEASAAVGEDPQVYDRVLRLRRMEQVDVSPERELVLRLTFSDRPDREQLTRHLKLSAPGQGNVDYRLAGDSGAQRPAGAHGAGAVGQTGIRARRGHAVGGGVAEYGQDRDAARWRWR
jgi:hypothetical protein